MFNETSAGLFKAFYKVLSGVELDQDLVLRALKCLENEVKLPPKHDQQLTQTRMEEFLDALKKEKPPTIEKKTGPYPSLEPYVVMYMAQTPIDSPIKWTVTTSSGWTDSTSLPSYIPADPLKKDK